MNPLRKESESRLSLLIRKNMTRRRILAIVVGGCLLFFLIQELIGAYASLNWPTAQGTIIKSEVSMCIRRGRNSWMYAKDEANIIYAYSVNGISYSSNQIVLVTDLFASDCGRNPKELLVEFPYGKSVLVYYDPSKPSRAVLKPGAMNVWPIAVPLAFVFLAIYVIFNDIFKGKKRKSRQMVDMMPVRQLGFKIL